MVEFFRYIPPEKKYDVIGICVFFSLIVVYLALISAVLGLTNYWYLLFLLFQPQKIYIHILKNSAHLRFWENVIVVVSDRRKNGRKVPFEDDLFGTDGRAVDLRD